MLVTSLPEENTTIQGSTKHWGNVPKWELQLRPEHKQRGGPAWGPDRQSTEAEGLEPVSWVPSSLLCSDVSAQRHGNR